MNYRIRLTVCRGFGDYAPRTAYVTDGRDSRYSERAYMAREFRTRAGAARHLRALAWIRPDHAAAVEEHFTPNLLTKHSS